MAHFCATASHHFSTRHSHAATEGGRSKFYTRISRCARAAAHRTDRLLHGLKPLDRDAISGHGPPSPTTPPLHYTCHGSARPFQTLETRYHLPPRPTSRPSLAEEQTLAPQRQVAGLDEAEGYDVPGMRCLQLVDTADRINRRDNLLEADSRTHSLRSASLVTVVQYIVIYKKKKFY